MTTQRGGFAAPPYFSFANSEESEGDGLAPMRADLALRAVNRVVTHEIDQ